MPQARQVSIITRFLGTRITCPCRSSSDTTGRRELVSTRNPENAQPTIRTCASRTVFSTSWWPMSPSTSVRASSALRITYGSVSTPSDGENGARLLMASTDSDSVPSAALLTVSSSLPSWPFGNTVTRARPPVLRSKAVRKALASSHCVPPCASPMANLKVTT